MSKIMNEKIQEAINESKIVRIFGDLEDLEGKYIENLQLIVKVGINIYDQGFWNGDICKVVAHLKDDQILIRRLSDRHLGVVGRNQIQYPKWESYSFK